MNNNKIVIMITGIALLVAITIPTIIKVIKNYNDKSYNSTIQKIELEATKCIEDKICNSEKITLKELYDNNYLEKIANPVNKEYFNENSYLILKNNEYEFVEE